MSNTVGSAGVILTTHDEINFYRFASLKGSLKLESKGLKNRSGPLRPQLAVEFGLKPRDSHDKYIAFCLQKMTEYYVAKHGKAPEIPFA